MNRVLAVLLLACSAGMVAYLSGRGAPEPVSGTFAGKVEGTAAVLRLVADGKRLRAYACADEQIAGLFSGRDDGNTFDLRSGGLRLQAKLTSGEAEGTLTLRDGGAHTFSLRRVDGVARLCEGAPDPSGFRASALRSRTTAVDGR